MYQLFQGLAFMHKHGFFHRDIKPENINIPNGEIDQKDLRSHCISFEKKIKKLGGIDLQILGIGRTGHIGFNEPGSHLNSQTRTITLHHLTRFDASSSFNGIENVHCDMPGGAFYMFPDFSFYLNKENEDGKILQDTFDLSDYILADAKVVTVAGDGFGASGYLRFSFATNKDTIISGIDRIKKSLKKLK